MAQTNSASIILYSFSIFTCRRDFTLIIIIEDRQQLSVINEVTMVYLFISFITLNN